MKRLLFAVLLALGLSSAASAQAPAGYTKLNTALITATTFTDSGCPNLTSCYYVVTAVDSLGLESQPASCSASQLCVGGNQALAQMPSSGTHTVMVAWVASTSTVSGYNVYVHRGPLPASSVTTTVN